MARIRRADTKPEMIVRRMLHAAGYRFRLQWKAAPGRPDVAFPGRRAIIFVHGCFWHQHPGCRHARLPGTRREFWQAKFDRNRARDARDLARAEEEGWRSLVLWECEITGGQALEARLKGFVGPVSNIRTRSTGLDLALLPEEGRIPRRERMADPRFDVDGA